MKKSVRTRLIVLIIAALICLGVVNAYRRPKNVIEYDGCYFWNEKETTFDKWHYAKSGSYWEYFLYIPSGVDYDDPAEKVPLIVTFHGQSGRYASLGREGRIFVNNAFQEASGGCAVLVMMSRIDHFTDPHSCARLIKNLTFKYPCLDMQNIAAYGSSQGAYFAVALAVSDPGLFKAVIAGSGFYDITLRDLIKVLPVQFFTAVSQDDDTAIFEPGSRTGKLLARFCRNSRYGEYLHRGHFHLELDDSPGIESAGLDSETLEQWLIEVLHN